MKDLPRGLRNHNPLNIIKNQINWLGAINNPSEAKFVTFKDDVWGYRAALILLRKYIRVYKLDCISKIVDRWAPDGEPHQTNYKYSVAKDMGIGIFDKIHFADASKMVDLVAAMAHVENGVKVDVSPIRYAYEMLCGSSAACDRVLSDIENRADSNQG